MQTWITIVRRRLYIKRVLFTVCDDSLTVNRTFFLHGRRMAVVRREKEWLCRIFPPFLLGRQICDVLSVSLHTESLSKSVLKGNNLPFKAHVLSFQSRLQLSKEAMAILTISSPAVIFLEITNKITQSKNTASKAFETEWIRQTIEYHYFLPILFKRSRAKTGLNKSSRRIFKVLSRFAI